MSIHDTAEREMPETREMKFKIEGMRVDYNDPNCIWISELTEIYIPEDILTGLEEVGFDRRDVDEACELLHTSQMVRMLAKRIKRVA